MTSPHEPDKDTMSLNMQVPGETEPEGNLSSLSNDGEAEMDECRWCEKHADVEVTMTEEEVKQSSRCERELREEQEEMKRKEEERKRSQINFQEELKKIMEAEKLHQKELELMGKRAQEKLEQEFQLQQELIRDLQRQVNEERKKMEVEHKRIKEEDEKKRKEMEEKMKKEEEEEERRKREAEKNKREMQRMEEETRKKEEDDSKRKIEEMRLKEKLRRKEEEQRRRREEEERRRVENEEKRERDEEKNRMHEEKEEERSIQDTRCKDEKTRRHVEQEEMIRKEGNEEIKEMKGNKTGKIGNMVEEDKRRKMSEDIGLKEWRGKEKGDSNTDVEDKRSEEEQRMTIEHEVRMKNEIRDLQKQEKKRSKEDEQEIVNEEGERKKKEEEKRKREKEEEEQRRTSEEEMNQREIEIERKRMGEDECKSVKEVEEKNKIQKDTRKKEKERNRKCEGEETENFMEEDRRRTTDEETEVKKCEKKNSDEENKRREEEQRMAKEAEVWMKKKEEEENGETKDENKRNEEEKTAKEKEKKQWREEEQKMEEELRPEKERELNNTNEVDKEKRQEEKEEQKTKTGEIQLKEDKESEKEERLSTITSSSRPGPSQSQSTSSPSSSETSVRQDQHRAAVTSHVSSHACLPEHPEQKRLSWMNECVPWSKLSLQNKNKQRRRGGADSRRRVNRTSECDSLQSPVCPHTVLMSTGCESLQQVTTVTLEDLPGCSLSTLAQCRHLQSLTLRRCGLKSLEGLNHLPNLCCVDVQENDISFVDCGNMASLRVLQLGHNKLTSIHGLSGAENLDVLDLSHNLISRIAGLESARRLQSLSLGHNQLISTKGLRDVSTLLHLDCSHNHLAVVEGLENNALLHTLDLKSNNIAEPPSLINHVLLRELHLDDNSVSSLQGLAVCWLPLMQHLSAAQNRITLLPSMSDFVSLANLDLRFNCISELHSVCESVAGCQFLRDVQLTGNPLQQESSWRSVLQRAVAGLRTIDGKETDSLLSAPAVPQVSLASGGFLTFCQAQLKQTGDLQQRHHRELSNASSPLDAVKCSCRHFTETLQLAVEQRFAHEYGDTTVSTLGQTAVEKTADMDSKKELPVIQSNMIPVDKSATEMSFHSSTTNEKPTSFHLEMAPESDHHELDSKNTAAAVIQQQWRKYREKCGNISCPPTAEKGGGGVGDRGEPDAGSSSVDRSVIEQDYAAIAIQAFWRGFILRRRLASALAVVTWPDSGEDETFEEVDVDGFVFDEAAEEKRWTLTLSEDSSSSGRHRVSQQPLSLKPLGPSPVHVHHTTPSIPHWRPKQAWLDGEQVDPAEERTSPESSNRLKSAAASVLSGLSAKSEKIVEEWGFKDSNTALLMLKRAQKMRTTQKQHQKIHQDPFVCQQGPVETRNRPAPHRRNHMRVSTAERQAKQMEKVKQERAQQWLHQQADRDSESERFLPEISSDILNGGRVQLVADPGYSEHLHHTSGLWASSSSAAQLSKERNYPRRNSASRPTGKEVPSPQRADSAPVKKERISFRDNPVQLSGGWGGGKKRVKGQVHK